MVEKEILRKWTCVAPVDKQSAGAEDFARGNQNIDIRTEAKGGIAIERLCQRDALQRENTNAGLAEELKQTCQLGDKEHISNGVEAEISL
jgi:hypothetical protein